MRILLAIFTLVSILSCSKDQGDIKKFKTGTFKTILDDSEATSTARRNDSLQIEFYQGNIDTFAIKWNSNFEYVLTMVNPKTSLDSTPFHVKITGFKQNSYKFTAFYKGSNFKQKGKAIKLKD